VLARNSASQILTHQLNKLSDQYIKGVDLNLDLDSYKATENGAAAQRTQLGLSLSKSLFDDRFKVQVGSQFELEGEQRSKQSASDILGNILIEYLLTEDGRYKLTGYRKNEYEGLIDGQVTLTGISVQFNKEFENFSDLLNATKNNLNED
jgi:translocation and assembly module TamB